MSENKYTFEDALARLETVVRELEDGQLPLERALELFGEGVALSRQCQQTLEKAEQRIAILSNNEKGELVLKDAKEAGPLLETGGK